ncbi:hypothetical protein C4J65_13420 [Streptomyces sp. CB09001]|nr:hypothetical protein C4J65_13420 [Streptomyces sp. CB09001]
MRPPRTTALDSVLAHPELRGLVLRHIERRRREGLRQAAEHSLRHRLLGGDVGGATESEAP